jgi:Flp pilus assembly protein TadB
VAIERNADKPKVVVAESRLAQSYLPAPPPQDIEFAMARATKADPVDYAKQMAFGRQLATAVTKAWEKLESQQAEALRVSQLKDKRIEDLTKEVEAVRKEASRNIWTLAGAGLAVLGAVTTAFAGPRIGLPLLACGAAMGAFPFVVESPHFDLIVTVTLSLGACLLIWVAWDYARDRVNAKPPQE